MDGLGCYQHSARCLQTVVKGRGDATQLLRCISAIKFKTRHFLFLKCYMFSFYRLLCSKLWPYNDRGSIAGS